MESTRPALVAPRRAAAAVQWKVVWERAAALKAAGCGPRCGGAVCGVGQGQVCGGGGMKGCLGEKFNMFGSWLFFTMRGHSTHVSANYAVNIQ